MRKILSKIENKVDPTFVSSHSTFIGKTFILNHCTVVVESIIAEGGFSIVFHVKHVAGTISLLPFPASGAISPNAGSSSKQHLALKRILVNNEQDLATCEQEIEVARAMSGHKNVITFLDSAIVPQADGVFEILILMDLCKDNVLRQMNDKISEGFPEPQVLKIFCDVCEALSRLHHHKKPIIHRDLKVENILLHASGNYVLCDFGSCTYQIMDPSTQNIQRLEDDIKKYTTLAYRSPEMVDLYSGKLITTKADIWALGCLLYKLCFFNTPFGENTLAIHEARFDFPKTSKYIPEIHALIAYMLQPDTDTRPDIYQVARVAFKLLHNHNKRILCPTRLPSADNYAFHCPVANKNKVVEVDISSLIPNLVAQIGDDGPQNRSKVHKSAKVQEPSHSDNGSRIMLRSLRMADATTNNPVSDMMSTSYITSIAPRERPKGKYVPKDRVSDINYTATNAKVFGVKTKGEGLLPRLKASPLPPSPLNLPTNNTPQVVVNLDRSASSSVNKTFPKGDAFYVPGSHTKNVPRGESKEAICAEVETAFADNYGSDGTAYHESSSAAPFGDSGNSKQDSTAFSSPKGWNPFEEEEIPPLFDDTPHLTTDTPETLGSTEMLSHYARNQSPLSECDAYDGCNSSDSGDEALTLPHQFPCLKRGHRSKGSYSSLSNVKSRESLVMSLSTSSPSSFSSSAEASSGEEAGDGSPSISPPISSFDGHKLTTLNANIDLEGKYSDPFSPKNDDCSRSPGCLRDEVVNPFENIPFKLGGGGAFTSTDDDNDRLISYEEYSEMSLEENPEKSSKISPCTYFVHNVDNPHNLLLKENGHQDDSVLQSNTDFTSIKSKLPTKLYSQISHGIQSMKSCSKLHDQRINSLPDQITSTGSISITKHSLIHHDINSLSYAITKCSIKGQNSAKVDIPQSLNNNIIRPRKKSNAQPNTGDAQLINDKINILLPPSSTDNHPHSVPTLPTIPPPPTPFDGSNSINKARIPSTSFEKVGVPSNVSDTSNYYSLRWKKGEKFTNDGTQNFVSDDHLIRAMPPVIQDAGSRAPLPSSTTASILVFSSDKASFSGSHQTPNLLNNKCVSNKDYESTDCDANTNNVCFRLKATLLRGGNNHNHSAYETLNDDNMNQGEPDLFDAPSSPLDYEFEYLRDDGDDDRRSILLPPLSETAGNGTVERIGCGGNGSIENLSFPISSSSRSSSTRKRSMAGTVISKYIRSPFATSNANTLEPDNNEHFPPTAVLSYNDSVAPSARIGSNVTRHKWLKNKELPQVSNGMAPSSFANLVFCSPNNEGEQFGDTNVCSSPDEKGDKHIPVTILPHHPQLKATSPATSECHGKGKKGVSAAVNYGFNNDIELINND